MANEILKTSLAVFPIVFFTSIATIQGTQKNKLILFCKSFNVTMSALFLFKRKK